MRRTPLTAFALTLLLACSAFLAACKNESQPAESSAAPAAQTQPAPVATTPVSSAPASTAAAPEATPAKKEVASRSTSSKPVEAAPALPAPAAAGLTDLDAKEARGSKSAPIVMETFSDYQCPACKQLYMNSSRQLTDNYVATGKVYLIHRDFPLPGHAYSRIAARYGRAAAQLGKLEQVEEVLFQNQEKWEQTGDVDGTLAAVFAAGDMNKIRALTKNPGVEAAIEKDLALGRSYSVNQTPTTIVHYKGQTYPIVGIVTYDNLHQFLDQLLSM
ncbi:MAG TPA: thioredoxin domain-containing protein [Candidatus Acidoferrum sp.]|nr:thioredoxin domain-containing protein [Candidatus Acidoferrum sp.]